MQWFWALDQEGARDARDLDALRQGTPPSPYASIVARNAASSAVSSAARASRSATRSLSRSSSCAAVGLPVSAAAFDARAPVSAAATAGRALAAVSTAAGSAADAPGLSVRTAGCDGQAVASVAASSVGVEAGGRWPARSRSIARASLPRSR